MNLEFSSTRFSIKITLLQLPISVTKAKFQQILAYMSPAVTQIKLEQLRPGDRVSYRGIQWRVKDYSMYTDPNGYETTEWLLQTSRSEYYLLREIDPQNQESLVNWYLAEEVSSPSISEPNLGVRVDGSLWHYMVEGNTPYPELQMFNRFYEFESQTKGTYEEGNRETSRITWDYWDKPHQWNLALEAWPNGQLHVYSTQVVDPRAFSQIVKGAGRTPRWLLALRWSLGVTGIILIIVGCTMLAS